jgi:hypothetical protein
VWYDLGVESAMVIVSILARIKSEEWLDGQSDVFFRLSE